MATRCTRIINVDYFIDSHKVTPTGAVRKFNAEARKAQRTHYRAVKATAWPNGTHTGRGYIVPYRMRVCIK